MLGIEFGEKLLWKEKAQSKMDKISLRWEQGIFVGSASPEWRVLGGHESGRQQGEVREAHSRGRSVVGRLHELGEACALAFVERSP